MKSNHSRLYRHAARLTAILLVMITASPVAAQDLPIADARPGPEFGTRAGDGLSLPTDIAVGIEGRVYVVDSGHHRVTYYDAMGNSLGSFGSMGNADAELQGPVGISIGPDSSIYVADRGNKRLQVFDANGKFIKSLVVAENGEAITPVDLAVGAKGKSLYVTASNSHRVLSVDLKGNVSASWGGEGKEQGQFRYPATVALDATGNVLVVDVLNQRIQVFDAGGTARTEFGELGVKPGMFIRPKGVAVDAGSGRVFVSDSYLGVVQVFTSAGEFIGVLGMEGVPARFEAPTGLAFEAGRLYVCDMLAGKVLSYDMENGQ